MIGLFHFSVVAIVILCIIIGIQVYALWIQEKYITKLEAIVAEMAPWMEIKRHQEMAEQMLVNMKPEEQAAFLLRQRGKNNDRS